MNLYQIKYQLTKKSSEWAHQKGETPPCPNKQVLADNIFEVSDYARSFDTVVVESVELLYNNVSNLKKEVK